MKQCGAEYINKPTAYYSQIYETTCKKKCKKCETNLLLVGSLEALCNMTNLFSFQMCFFNSYKQTTNFR